MTQPDHIESIIKVEYEAIDIVLKEEGVTDIDDDLRGKVAEMYNKQVMANLYDDLTQAAEMVLEELDT